MTREELRTAFAQMGPDELAKARMLDNITKAAAEKAARRRFPARALAAAACLLVALAAAGVALRTRQNALLPPESSSVSQSESAVTPPESGSSEGDLNPDIGGPSAPDWYAGDDAPCYAYNTEFYWGNVLFVPMADQSKGYPQEISADALGEMLDAGGVDCFSRENEGERTGAVSAVFYAVQGYDANLRLAVEFTGWEGRYFLYHPFATADGSGLTLGDFAKRIGLRRYAVTAAQETISSSWEKCERRYSGGGGLPGLLDILLEDGALPPCGASPDAPNEVGVTLTRSDDPQSEAHLYLYPGGFLRIRCDTQNEWYEIGAERAGRAMALIRDGMDCKETVYNLIDTGGDELLTNPD